MSFTTVTTSITVGAIILAFAGGWKSGQSIERAKNTAAQLEAMQAAQAVEAVSNDALANIESGAADAAAEVNSQDFASVSRERDLKNELRNLERELRDAVFNSQGACDSEPIDFDVRLQLDRYHDRLDGYSSASGDQLAGNSPGIDDAPDAGNIQGGN